MKINNCPPTLKKTALAAVAAAVIAVPVAAVAAPGGGGGGGGSVLRDVRVVNTTDEPIPVAPQGVQEVSVVPQGQPISVTNPMTMAPGENLLQIDLIDVPAGKRFVIEYVSAETVRFETGRVRMRVGDATGPQIRLPIQPGFGSEGSLVRGTVSETVKLVVDGPSAIQAIVARLDPDLDAGVSAPVTVTGTMYDCATCS